MKKFILLLLSGLLMINSTGITGCSTNGISESDIYFPVSEEPIRYYQDNLSSAGKLILDGKYLLLKNSFPFYGIQRLLIWPYGYSVDVENGKIHVLDENGQVVASVGDTIKVGGGEIPYRQIEKIIGESLPVAWEGICWLVSKVVSD